MSTVSGEILIHAPVHDVFAFASDWRHWEEWFAGTAGFRPLTPETRGNGARYAYRASVLGLPFPIQTEIRDFIEDQGWRGVSRRGPKNETRWRFEAEGEDTRFGFSMTYHVPGLPDVLDRLLVRPVGQRLVEQSVENLKARVERGRTAAAAALPSPAPG